MEKDNKYDYVKILAAQNEADRRLKIKKIINTLSEEKKQKAKFSIASGVCFSGLLASILFSGFEPMQALQSEIQALNSFDALKDFISNITPAMFGTMISTAYSYVGFIIHSKKYNNANQEFYDMIETHPDYYRNFFEEYANKEREKSERGGKKQWLIRVLFLFWMMILNMWL